MAPVIHTTANAAPATSIRPDACGSRVSGTRRSVTARTTPATGRLMKNTQRHEPIEIRYPPTSGPAAVARPPRPDQAPMARGRSSARNEAWRMARLAGASSAAPTPWSTRAATSHPAEGAKPHRADATANQATPMENTRARPNRSPNEPASSRKAARVSR